MIVGDLRLLVVFSLLFSINSVVYLLFNVVGVYMMLLGCLFKIHEFVILLLPVVVGLLGLIIWFCLLCLICCCLWFSDFGGFWVMTDSFAFLLGLVACG